MGQKTKHFVPKKRKDSAKEQPKVKRNTVSKARNSSITGNKRPPLKPNLKGNKPLAKVEKSDSSQKQNKAQRKPSINTNPFKPPKPSANSVIKKEESVKIEKVEDNNANVSDDEIQSDYGMIATDANQTSAELSQTIENSNIDASQSLDQSEVSQGHTTKFEDSADQRYEAREEEEADEDEEEVEETSSHNKHFQAVSAITHKVSKPEE